MRRRSVLVAITAGLGGCLRTQQSQRTQQPQQTGTSHPTSQASTTTTDSESRSVSGTITLTLNFNTTVAESTLNESISDGRQLAFMCYSVVLWNDGSERIGEFDIGGAEDGVELEGGYYQPEQTESDGDDTFRWFGGSQGATTLRLGPFESPITPQYTVLVGTPAVDDEITATVSVNGTETDVVEFGTRGTPERTVLSMQPSES